MGEDVNRLLAYMGESNAYAVSAAELRDTQVAAMNERL